jgi:hypothetical protein
MGNVEMWIRIAHARTFMATVFDLRRSTDERAAALLAAWDLLRPVAVD